MTAWAGYDAWLEAPYQRAAAVADEYDAAEEMLLEEPVEFDSCDCEETHTSLPDDVEVEDIRGDKWEVTVTYGARCPKCQQMVTAHWSRDNLP